ncbi:LOXL3 isoform 3 [Pan troglodytes]|uniref:Lysyl oxidase homolog n=2 Tax=Pan troglodytes TaxID=9598 RepID=A0A2I3RIV6_PANTR|nr:LOXL3 isoform 3 [Pan troglodytes]
MRPVSVWQWSPWGLLLCLLCSSCLGSPSPSTGPEKKAGSQGLRFRLAGFPRKPYEGRVEIQRAGEWGTICDDDFTLQAAHVLCRELGFTEATGWTHSAKYGPGTGRIWLDNLSCSGTEQSVTECASRGWGNSDCTHDEDAGVICKDQRLPGFSDSNVIEVEHHLQVEEVRIRPAVGWGRRPLPVTEGLVEVRLPDGWSQVCDKGWSAHNSHVVCGMLGFPSEKRVNAAFYRLLAQRQQHSFGLHGVACVGTEAHLSLCSLEFYRANDTARCPGGAPAVVSCVPGPLYAASSGQKKQQQSKPQGEARVRLKGGAHPGEGRVEVLKASTWGTVCDRKWDLHAASVVCRELGFGSAQAALSGARMGQDVSKRYECANFGEQGITVGCWDLYRHDIDCQWIDITDVKPGNYILQVVINPNFEVAESDFTNNAMKCNCKYDGHRIWVHNCHIGDAFSEEANRRFERYPGQTSNQII